MLFSSLPLEPKCSFLFNILWLIWLSGLSGIESFEGRYFHSWHYRSAEDLQGKRVLVVGIGNSGADLAVDISRVAEKVHDSLFSPLSSLQSLIVTSLCTVLTRRCTSVPEAAPGWSAVSGPGVYLLTWISHGCSYWLLSCSHPGSTGRWRRSWTRRLTTNYTAWNQIMGNKYRIFRTIERILV